MKAVIGRAISALSWPDSQASTGRPLLSTGWAFRAVTYRMVLTLVRWKLKAWPQ